MGDVFLKILFSELHQHKKIVIFGYAGVGKALYKYITAKFDDVNIIFCDNSSERQGVHDCVSIFSVNEVVEKYADRVFIVASLYHSNAMHEQLIKAGILDDYIVTELPRAILEAEEEVEKMKRITNREQFRFEININKQCNLNCKGCDHFAPIAKADFMDLDMLERDVRRLSELFDRKAWQIHLLGGEPLLNPYITSYMKVVRNYFPIAEIFIDTNGTLLANMDKAFWEACQNYQINIMPTRYPVKVDYEALGELVRSYGLKYEFLGSSEGGRTLWHFPLDLKGKQDPKESFIHCRNANQCLTLENSRLYTCSIAPNIKAFNEYFKQHIQLTEDDGIDIYKAKSADEVLTAMACPMPFCRYCDVKHRTYDHPWEFSKKSIKEWTL